MSEEGKNLATLFGLGHQNFFKRVGVNPEAASAEAFLPQETLLSAAEVKRSNSDFSIRVGDWLSSKGSSLKAVHDAINAWGQRTDDNFELAFNDIKQNLRNNRKEAYLEHNKKKTSIQEGLTIGSAAIAEIPFLGPIYGLVALAGGTAVMGVIELNKMAKLKGADKDQGYSSRSAMAQTIRAVGQMIIRKGSDTAKGKKEIGKDIYNDIEDLQLTNAEVALAGLVGFSASFVSMALLSDVSLVSLIPIVGMKAMRRLATPILTSLIARGFASIGAGYYDGLLRKGEFNEVEAGSRKEEFVKQCLRVNAPVMQALTLGSMGLGVFNSVDWASFGHQIGKLLQNFKNPEIATSSPIVAPLAATPTPKPTSEATLAANLKPTLTATLQAATATGTPQPEMPPSDFGWQAGEAVDSTLLEKAASQGHLIDPTPRTISILGHELQLYGFNLDNDSDRDVLAIKDDQGNYTPVIWETFGGFYKVDIPNDDIGPLNYPGDVFNQGEMDIFQVGSSGGGGEFSPNLQGGQNWDLDNDGDDDLIPLGNDQWFIDKNNNFVKDESDLQLKDIPVFNSAGDVVKLEAVDGQKWWLDSGGKMTGLVFHSGKWWLDHGGFELDEANPVSITPFTSGGIEVKTGDIQAFELKPAGEETFRLVLKDAVVEFKDGSQWQYDASGELVKEGCVLADGQTLAFDRGVGAKGIMAWQYQLALAHPDWTPDEVGKEAFRHQSEPININLSRPEPYHSSGGTLTWPDLVKTEAGGQEGVIQGQLWNNGSPNLSAQQAGQAAAVAVMNGHTSGSAMIADVNASITRFSLENVFGQKLIDNMGKYGLNEKFISGYAARAAWDALQDKNIAWTIPNNSLILEPLGDSIIKNSPAQGWDSWLEEWLKDHGYIN